MYFFRPPHPPLLTSVKTQNEPPVTLKCLNCNEEFSDLCYLKVHSKIHNSNNEVNHKNNQLQNNEQLNSGDANTLECDESSEQPMEYDVNQQTNDFHDREIEIKLEITNIVTLKDQLDGFMDESKHNDNEQIKEEANEEQIKEEANVDFKVHQQVEHFEPGKSDIVENSEQDFVVRNNEELINDNDLVGQKCLKSFNADDESKTRVSQDENRVDLFENNENFKLELAKTNEDDLMVNKDENELAKVLLLETDA